MFHGNFAVTQKSMALEIIGHVDAGILASILGLFEWDSYIQRVLDWTRDHADPIDIGVSGYDWNRQVWDIYARLMWLL
ncbi:MAG: hypothetical protein IBX64_01225 [Actinobacteria bacterium]|nr:hypothetical protein [Actinomycetota bacterium]